MIIEAPLMRIVEQQGYTNTKSLQFLHNLVMYIQPNYVLELGTGYGCSTAFMATALNAGKVISIDNHQDQAKTIDIPTENVKACGVADKVILLEGSSFNVVELLTKAGIKVEPEIIFMDASHMYDNLVKEHASFRKVLPKDHIIIVDDADTPPVFKFACELMQQYEFGIWLKHFHYGMAIVCTNPEYLTKIDRAIWHTHD